MHLPDLDPEMQADDSAQSGSDFITTDRLAVPGLCLTLVPLTDQTLPSELSPHHDLVWQPSQLNLAVIAQACPASRAVGSWLPSPACNPPRCPWCHLRMNCSLLTA